MESNPAPSKRAELPRYGPWLALFSVLAIGGWFVLLRPRMNRSRASAGVEENLGELRQCLLGSAGTPSARRFRRRLISTQVASGPAAQRWPARCAPFATKLRSALDQLLASMPQRCAGKLCCPDDQRCEHISGLKTLSDNMRNSLRQGTARFETLQAMLELARNAELDPQSSAATATALPREAELFAPDGANTGAVWQGQHHALRFAAAGLDARLLIVRQKKLARLCTFVGLHDTSSAQSVECNNLPAKVPVALAPSLLESAAGGPARLLHLVAGPPTKGETQRIVRDATTGATLFSHRSRQLDVVTLSGGRVAALSTDESGKASLHLADGKGVQQKPLAVALGDSVNFGPWLAADVLIWGERTQDDGKPPSMNVLARPIVAPSGANTGPEELELTLGATQQLGSLQSMSVATVETCQAAETTWLLLRAAPRGHQTQVALSVRSAAGQVPGPWSPLLLHTISSASFGFSCAGGQASLAHTELFDQRGGRGRLSIKRTRCQRSGCSDDSAELDLVRRSGASPFLLGDLGNAVALLWQSALGDIRLRVAPLDKLASAPARSLFDDDKHGGFAWDASSSLHVHGGAGLLVVQARPSKSVHAWSLHTFRIDASGEVRPLRP